MMEDQQKIKKIQQISEKVYYIGKMVYNSLKDFHKQFDQFSQIQQYFEQYEGQLCISHT